MSCMHGLVVRAHPSGFAVHIGILNPAHACVLTMCMACGDGQMAILYWQYTGKRH